MRIMLTGASGFVGRQALEFLVASGHDVYAVSRREPKFAGRYAWHPIDLLSAEGPLQAVLASQPDIILHLAWCVEHGRFWTDDANLAWLAASLELVRAARENGVTRFVGTGTCYEYDWPSERNCDERTTPLAAHTLYDASKDACRRALESYCRQYGMSFAWGRLFFLYGPQEAQNRLVASVAHALAQGDAAECSDGVVIRDFMDVRDAGAALSALALADVEGSVNIASGEAVSIAEVVTKMGQLAGHPELVRLGARANRTGEPPRIVAEVGRLRNEVGFTPSRNLEAGLKDALSFWSGKVSGRA